MSFYTTEAKNSIKPVCERLDTHLKSFADIENYLRNPYFIRSYDDRNNFLDFCLKLWHVIKENEESESESESEESESESEESESDSDSYSDPYKPKPENLERQLTQFKRPTINVTLYSRKIKRKTPKVGDIFTSYLHCIRETSFLQIVKITRCYIFYRNLEKNHILGNTEPECTNVSGHLCLKCGYHVNIYLIKKDCMFGAARKISKKKWGGEVLKGKTFLCKKNECYDDHD